jgi:hypothetical protein
VRLTILTLGGRISSSPLLTAGRVGAADCVYLRRLSGGRYVIGLDHWSAGTIESAPFDLADADIHSIGIEMASLGAGGEVPDGTLRVWVDGRRVMDSRTVLYGVQPEEVFFGANPLGMSTSARVFEGDLISVHTHLAAADLLAGSR